MPVGIRTKIIGDVVSLTAVVLSEDGKQRIIADETGSIKEVEMIGLRLAEK